MTANEHLTHLIEDRKNEYTVYIQEGNKVEKLDSCKILALDNHGVTVEEMKKLGKNRVYFIPMFKLIKLRSEIF